MDFELTLLTKDEMDIHGTQALEVIKKESIVPITEFAVLNGANYSFGVNTLGEKTITGNLVLSTSSIKEYGYYPWYVDAFSSHTGLLQAFPGDTELVIRPVLIPHNFDTFVKKINS